MSSQPAQDQTYLIIPGLTPTFMGRPALWFSENAEHIRRAVLADPWWQKHALIIDAAERRLVSKTIRELAELGYERVNSLEHVGQFRVLGDTLDVFPLAAAHPWRIEFLGNTVEAIRELTADLPAPRAKFKLKEEILREGDYVVHADHGIGVFRGTILDPLTGQNFLALAYAPPPRPNAPPDRLLVPPDQREKITRYIGFDKPTVHRLGGSVWLKTRQRVKEETLALAKQLLELYASRELARRPPALGEGDLEAALAASFEHAETQAQTQALQEILADLSSDRPMDRVLVADVGFGKTEVALRAAGRVLASGRQVAFIAPTTILAHQHISTIAPRLAPLGFAVAALSRLTSKPEVVQTLAGLRTGTVDCVVGTHRLLSRDVSFKNLGLLIIDEEQRFGVRHKERFKELRHDLDVLSLSATPIPRTLYLALSNLRAVSTITAAPPGRLPTRTYVLPFSWKLVREAIQAELKRGGQVYYLHNRIETIQAVLRRLETSLPRARIAVVHGRISERMLVETMARFREDAVQVLVATTIIENGLDFSNANTLIVDNALRLGLAQAHQLRGRIGRGTTEAYAYFLYRSRHLTAAARERLEALEELQHLGAGYEIALRDLELRGAGNVLGREQSGSLNQVGLNLYCDMLAEAVETLREHQNAKVKTLS
ncbi:DEAD/DEAH box helicase [Candidatus Parcubacteria bacterium]|nr:DEAD/DEAH box helicase [Candidatus Parcubacteria bacterium]